MKKFLTAILCAVLCVVSAIAFTACGKKESGELTVFMPDGAPALSMARLMHEQPDFGRKVNYRVVDASEINSCVTYADEPKNADLCVLPVNAASKFLGSGERYKMLGTVTHGNLFIAAASEKEELTRENFAESIQSAKVGVVNLPAFPGAVFKLLLEKYSATATLENVAPTAVSGVQSEYDYFVIPEPAASTRAGNAKLNLKIVGDLQTLYGDNGYPQAVLVAKNSLIESDPEFISAFKEKMGAAATWLLSEEVSAETIISAISANYADPENTKPAFTAQQLTKTVIENCAVSFVDCRHDYCVEGVTAFLNELKAAGDAAATPVADGFFYRGI